VLLAVACTVSLWRYFDSAPAPARVSGRAAAAAEYRIDLNRADAARLDLLPGIGPVTSGAIVRYRQEHGPFGSLKELERVPGIGPKKIERIQPYVTVNGAK
jgi:competence protein ComEA